MQNVPRALYNIFGIVWKLNLLNVNVLIEDGNSMRWSLHSYMPYMQHCNSFDVHSIKAFTAEDYTVLLDVPFENLFPPNTFKFNHCPLYISVIPFRPYVIIQSVANETGKTTYDGIDVSIVKHISNCLNLNPIYVQSHDHKNRSMIYTNETVTGAMNMVSMASLFIGGEAPSSRRALFSKF